MAPSLSLRNAVTRVIATSKDSDLTALTRIVRLRSSRKKQCTSVKSVWVMQFSTLRF